MSIDDFENAAYMEKWIWWEYQPLYSVAIPTPTSSDTLELDSGNWSRFSFDFPSLKRLRVGVWNGRYLSGLPNLQPEAIELVISDNPEESEIETWLKEINLKYPSLKLLILSTSAETACRDVIARLKEETSWPSTLEDVRIVPREGGEVLYTAFV